MSKLIFAVGSTNEDKISGIDLGLKGLHAGEIISNLNSYQKSIFKILRKDFDREILINSYKVNSDVSDMPKSLQETISGATYRAMNLIDLGIEADYYLGTEGGIDFTYFGKSLLYSAVCIIDKCGEAYIGISNGLSISKEDTLRLRKGEDLSDIMRDKHGSIGEGSVSGDLSLGIFPRSKQFEDAFKSAMIPFCNTKYY